MTTGKQPLQRIFEGNKARVLDHLATCRPLDYSIQELVSILGIDVKTIDDILEHLENNQLVEFTKKKRYRLAENKITLALCEFQFEVAWNDVDKVVAKHKKDKENNKQ